jgi:FtsH-binding integral membrane protein
MPLNKSQYRLLHIYRRFRDQGGPRLGDFLGLRTFGFLIGSTLIILGASLNGWLWFSGLGVGLFAGLLLIQVTNARHVIRNWPTIAEVVDWQRLDTLLREEEQPPPVA